MPLFSKVCGDPGLCHLTSYRQTKTDQIDQTDLQETQTNQPDSQTDRPVCLYLSDCLQVVSHKKNSSNKISLFKLWKTTGHVRAKAWSKARNQTFGPQYFRLCVTTVLYNCLVAVWISHWEVGSSNKCTMLSKQRYYIWISFYLPVTTKIVSMLWLQLWYYIP